MDGDPAEMNVSQSSSSMEVKEDVNTRSDSENQAAGDALVDINFCGSTPMLWKVSDMKKCRSVGVIGALVGSLARQPRQNVRLGRPLELLQEEALLLVETGSAAASLHTQDCGDEEMHSEAVRQYEAGLESSYKEQCALALEDKKTVLRRIISEKENGTDDSGNAIRDRLNALDQAFCFPLSAMAVQLCTARAGFSHCPEERSFLSTDWPVPRDERLNTRFCVYRDLRSKGFYLTSAGKFGGDFLVYPGDPLRFHAHFIALCISMDEELPLSDILSIARLGSNVKKTVLLCSPQSRNETGKDESVEGDVVYSSLQWSSMV
ncbi:tRNA-splicing endonuclease subunit Sen34 [Megalobrama amblycephala]|uniref:tRNA-splicing endonuclease subunit Sen34 n=1 Tax=Megalobrama amblycephala TaxID=75352 RepID=UPI0020143B55|nr:tRNA-splicing endonuclease subunit Sen34 [Megalobrama amblycephala]XP_048024907.1 tRNA-splicing endonuclease subunit Sen34 [Megalobrama amblycephala]XP_048024908.1 tRNA-splicing endonuclease subunit Sen34 [Megalobrama amblycephala]